MSPPLILPVIVPPVYPIGEACDSAVRLALRTGAWVRFEWNGVEVTARGENDARVLAEHTAEMLRRGGKLSFL